MVERRKTGKRREGRRRVKELNMERRVMLQTRLLQNKR